MLFTCPALIGTHFVKGEFTIRYFEFTARREMKLVVNAPVIIV